METSRDSGDTCQISHEPENHGHRGDKVNETDFSTQIVDLFKLFGYKYYHTHDSRRSVAGFPDYVAVKGSRVLFIELKKEKGTLSPEQVVWGEILSKCPGVEYYIWRPSQADEVEAILKGEK